jgi:thiol-disulfide isomerase/thioredoxin
MKSLILSCSVRKWTLITVLVAAILSWIFLHTRVDDGLSLRLFFNSNNPREELFEDLAKRSTDPVDFLRRSWVTGKVVHRQFVAQFLKDNSSKNPPWFARAEPLLLACLTDADASVRELALGAMDNSHNPRLLDAAKLQLDDLDPLVRQIGLGYLRKSDPHKALPLVIRMLDDPDLRIVTEAEVGLAHWSGEDFRIKTRMAIPQAGAAQIEPSTLEAIHSAVEKRKEWWKTHKAAYSANSTPGPPISFSFETDRPLAPDFKLRDLNGNAVRLSDFRGKVVLINFWATWCTACIAEIPDLIALQSKKGNEVAILGVALDGIPDEHGDIPGEDGHDVSHENRPSPKAVHAKVARTAKARQINYPILLDDKNSVGGQYNGGELPTTIIIDAEGRLRRRFIGERNLLVFEAMIAEAKSPLNASRVSAHQ